MPLFDHFHPPLSVRRHWHSFHNAWATRIAAHLNRWLPEEYFAEPNVQFDLEIDVASWEEDADQVSSEPELPSARAVENGGVATASWAPPRPRCTMDFRFEEETIEIAVYSTQAGPTLVGAIELVSPANKDRPEHREVFVAKCQTYLHQGVGLIVVDVVTNRRANLHHQLLDRLDPTGALSAPARLDSNLYAAAYRPIQINNQPRLQVWAEGLSVANSLPTMPLWLLRGPCAPIELEDSYRQTGEELRLTRR